MKLTGIPSDDTGNPNWMFEDKGNRDNGRVLKKQKGHQILDCVPK